MPRPEARVSPQSSARLRRDVFLIFEVFGQQESSGWGGRAGDVILITMNINNV